MFKPQHLSPLVLSLVLGAAVVLAQPAASESTDAPEPPSKTQPENAPVESPPAAAPNESPFDYRPSEEISEDLPVSFPVDI